VIYIKTKAQIATEYLVIVGLVLILLVPLTILYAKYSSESSHTISISKVDSITNQIVATVNQVNVYGEDTKLTLDINFPSDISEINFDGNEINIKVIGSGNEINEIVKVADTFLVDPGNPIPKVYSSIAPGRKEVQVISRGNYVEVIIMCGLSECI